jgi:pentapeptide MXKDX repeat protein
MLKLFAAAALSLILATGAASAEGKKKMGMTTGDAMKTEQSMKKDAMAKKDEMMPKGDAMKKDAMAKKDAMMKGAKKK